VNLVFYVNLLAEIHQLNKIKATKSFINGSLTSSKFLNVNPIHITLNLSRRWTNSDKDEKKEEKAKEKSEQNSENVLKFKFQDRVEIIDFAKLERRSLWIVRSRKFSRLIGILIFAVFLALTSLDGLSEIMQNQIKQWVNDVHLSAVISQMKRPRGAPGPAPIDDPDRLFRAMSPLSFLVMFSSMHPWMLKAGFAELLRDLLKYYPEDNVGASKILHDMLYCATCTY
jgi:hypothetical protein